MNTQKPTIILTRYLYLKDEVEIALLMSLLNKKDSSLFWAFELYFSGFETELWDLFWKIYYEFYAALNATMEAFILTKQKEFISTETDEEEKKKIIAVIVNNLLVRKYTLDVFLLRQVVEQFEIEQPTTEETLEQLLKKADYEQLASFILEVMSEEALNDTLEKIVDYFISKGVPLKKAKILKDFKKLSHKNKNLILLSKTINYFHRLNGVKMGKSWYIYVEEENLKQYETIYNSETDSRNILEKACLYGTNESGYLGAFKLSRELVADIKTEYRFSWLYYASFTPVWASRIEKYGGFRDHETQKVQFQDDDFFDAFYNEFQYDPDEQNIDIQDKNIPFIKTDFIINQFLKSYSKLNIYKIDESYIDYLEKLSL
jgi:hypothetical protein